MSVTPEQAQRVYEEADCLFTREQVETAIIRMANAITADLAEKNPLILAVMSGAMIRCKSITSTPGATAEKRPGANCTGAYRRALN